MYCAGKMNVTSHAKCSTVSAAICLLEPLFGKGKQSRSPAGSEVEQKLFYRENDEAGK
jgi:hypothetical protein